MKRKPILGETLYAVNVGNAAWRAESVATPVRVLSVGTKYFTCGTGSERLPKKFRIDTWRQVTDFSPDCVLYETEQAWLDENRANKLWSSIGGVFRGYQRSLSLDALEQITAIIQKESP